MTILAKFLTKLRLLAERDGRVIRMAVTRDSTLAPLPFPKGEGVGGRDSRACRVLSSQQSLQFSAILSAWQNARVGRVKWLTHHLTSSKLEWKLLNFPLP